MVVAPESERSGFSSALTLDRPLRPIQISPDVWAVNGTPADCVYLAMNGLFDVEFDLVVSGINSGANLGDDVLYSGTVGLHLKAVWPNNLHWQFLYVGKTFDLIPCQKIIALQHNGYMILLRQVCRLCLSVIFLM